MRNEKMIRVLQNVHQNFQNLLKDARNEGDFEIVNAWVLKVLRERGFKFEIVAENQF